MGKVAGEACRREIGWVAERRIEASKEARRKG